MCILCVKPCSAGILPILDRCRFDTTLYYYNITCIVQLRRGHQLLGRAGSGLTQRVTYYTYACNVYKYSHIVRKHTLWKKKITYYNIIIIIIIYKIFKKNLRPAETVRGGSYSSKPHTHSPWGLAIAAAFVLAVVVVVVAGSGGGGVSVSFDNVCRPVVSLASRRVPIESIEFKPKI